MYDGEDLIIAMGVPGSRWSGALRLLSLLTDQVNTSDEKQEWTYDKKATGWHRGCYFGPGHAYGQGFDNLQQYSKQQLLDEFKKPYKHFDGIKIIKSHWFSYDIPLLLEYFPKAKFISFYVDDNDAFRWWHDVGGWDITYPIYDWYENDEKMLKQIAIENMAIKRHFNVQRYDTWQQVTHKLGLGKTRLKMEEILAKDAKFYEFNHKNYENDTTFDVWLSNIFARTKIGII